MRVMPYILRKNGIDINNPTQQQQNQMIKCNNEKSNEQKKSSSKIKTNPQLKTHKGVRWVRAANHIYYVVKVDNNEIE